MDRDPDLTHDSSRSRLNEVFVGHTVTVASDDTLTLDDGTVLHIVANEGAWGCGCGSYLITELNGCNNIITGCKIVTDEPEPYSTSEDAHIYRLFVYSGHRRINLLTVEGDDGTGMYGTGFAIYVQQEGT